jgi:transcriptional regulator with XRE-family HTH domain
MSNLEDEGARLSRRISDERRARKWSLADLADRSGVSKAMLSKVERGEASPTAQVLVRIASAFGETLAGLLTAADGPSAGLLRLADQESWTDPASGYRRRQIYLSASLPLELVEVELPAGASVSVPAAAYRLIRQVAWVIEGRLTICEGASRAELAAGDRLEFGPPSDVVFRNDGSATCRYLVAVLRNQSASKSG